MVRPKIEFASHNINNKSNLIKSLKVKDRDTVNAIQVVLLYVYVVFENADKINYRVKLHIIT